MLSFAAMMLPPPVQHGDRVSVVAPAGPVQADLLASGIAVLQSWGLHPVVHEQVHRKQAYLAGPDEARTKALVEAFTDPTTTAVICAKGGYGCTRLLVLLEEEELDCQNLLKKRFFGFSDITALHCWLHKVLPGYHSFHSPMPATSLFTEGSKASKLSLRAALFEPELKFACPPLQGQCLQMGRAAEHGGMVRGRLVGGNLSLVVSLIGTPWQIDLQGAILLLEDVNEDIYRVDRMFTQLVTASGGVGALAQWGGLALGDFTGIAADLQENTKAAMQDNCERDLERWFWLSQMRLPPSLPVISGLPIGHIKDNRVVPIGAVVEMDLNSGTLQAAL